MSRKIGALLLPALMIAGCVSGPSSSLEGASTADRTVYVTRHMHKGDGPDPALSATGVAAADRLAELLHDKGIAAIFATPTRRAMETAAPLARRTGVRVRSYDAGDPAALVAAAAAVPGAVLVVGHSNTVADLVTRFGARTPPAPLGENDYGRVFVVKPTGEIEVIDL